MSENDKKEYLKTAEVAARWPVVLSRAKLERWRAAGEGPPVHRIGGHCYYLAAEIEAWLDACRIEPGHTEDDLARSLWSHGIDHVLELGSEKWIQAAFARWQGGLDIGLDARESTIALSAFREATRLMLEGQKRGTAHEETL